MLLDVTLRSLEATWSRERRETLPEDGNRYEVVDGVLHMSTVRKLFHQWVVQQTLLALDAQVDQRGIGWTNVGPLAAFMGSCTPVQPDLVVVRAADRDIFSSGYVEGVPALILEVLSPGTAGYDDHTKRHAYAVAGLPEYWIARLATRDVLVCSRPDAERGDYAQTQLVGSREELVSPTLPVRFPVDRLFAGSPDTSL
jgi:Uma2 family endonuclease